MGTRARVRWHAVRMLPLVLSAAALLEFLFGFLTSAVFLTLHERAVEHTYFWYL